jgi:hypothetical protein
VSTSEERAARYRDLFEGSHRHESNCAYCPICATIAVVRNTRPEVLEHLAGAAREMLAAVSILVEEAEQVVGSGEAGSTKEPGGAPSGRSPGAKVRRIDVN